MITPAQIKDLKTANTKGPQAVGALIEKWEGEHFAKEIAKSGSVQFKLKALKGDEVRDVVGQLVAPDFAFHKDVWGGSDWILTHVPTGIKVIFGKRAKCAAAVKAITACAWLKTLGEKMMELEFKALSAMPQEAIDEYRKIYNQARGAK